MEKPFRLFVVQFVADAAALEKRLKRLKLCACPYCGRIGTLNRHDKRRTQAWHRPCAEQAEVCRGQRAWCSTRGRRGGCGRTIMFYFSWVLPGRAITAPMLWRALRRLRVGRNLHTIHRHTARHLTPGAIRTAIKRAGEKLSEIRRRLPGAPPPGCESDSPMAQTIEHLRSAFPSSICPIMAFQEAYNAPFPA